MKRKKSQIVLSVAVVIAVTTFVQTNTQSTAKAEMLEKERPIIEKIPENNDKISHIQPNENAFKTPLEKEQVEKQESKQVKAILPYIQRAEQTLSGEDKYLAQLLIEKLDEKDRLVFQERLDSITPNHLVNGDEKIKKAEKEVVLAEKDIKNEIQLRKAQEAVNDLMISEQRTDLVERLHIIHMKLINEMEKEKRKTKMQRI